jgi:hypothetical protein
MPEYSLKFLVDSSDLVIIKAAQQRITLAKPVNGGSPNVIWLSIDPFASTDVKWTEEYGIYASTSRISNGVTIDKLSETTGPAVDGAYYSFTAATVFNGPFTGEGVTAGTFAARNDVPSSAYPVLTFGLTQSALINKFPAERKPLSATSVLATQFVEMTPFAIVYAWLQSQFTSETIITKITGKSAKVSLGGGVTSMTLKYNPELGMFVPATPQGKFADHAAVQLLAPAVF